VLLLNRLTINDSKVLELTRRNAGSVEYLDLGVGSVLGLRLEEPKSGDDEELGANEQEHDSATPVELIGVDEVREDGREHESSKLLADQGERDGLGSGCLRSSLLSDSPAVAANSSGVEHRPGDHEDQESSVGSSVGRACDRCTTDNDRPEHKDCTTADKPLASGDDIRDTDGNEVGQQLQSGRDGCEAEGIGLPDEFEVVSLICAEMGIKLAKVHEFGQQTDLSLGKVPAREVLRLEAEDGNEGSGAVLLGKDGLPACLAFTITLSLGLLQLSPDDGDTLLNVCISSE